ncbi:hypothetical protein [Kutzneria sp. 744]|uniref:hypothetical protein n=1 Tax=Kutzneria sp. (strain 744) TaxID=345341 RepID=UPI00069430FA|nr:hypothetical protein [Kutzneria sp. 744]
MLLVGQLADEVVNRPLWTGGQSGGGDAQGQRKVPAEGGQPSQRVDLGAAALMSGREVQQVSVDG